MTDGDRSTAPIHGHRADDAPHAHRTTGHRWTGFVARRWPTALGVAVAALTAYGMDRAAEIVPLSPLVVVLALVYVGSAALDRRWSAWAVLVAGLPVAFFLVPASGVAAAAVLILAALLFLILGAARGLLRRPGGLTLQAAAMLVFGAVMLVAVYVQPVVGGTLVAVGLIGHGAWDAFHYVRDRVVARSYAEFCAVLDLLVGAAVLFVLFVR